MCKGLKPYSLLSSFFIHAQKCDFFFRGGGRWGRGRGFKILTDVVFLKFLAMSLMFSEEGQLVFTGGQYFLNGTS